MKKAIFLSVLCILMAKVFAQPITPQSIKDSVIGWMKVYNFKGAKAGMKVDDKMYSANQLSICDSFVNSLFATFVSQSAERTQNYLLV